jgi:cob(I)alamin adenosyltransferase
MKIYTKTGDQGQTGLYGGPRVPKDHLRIEAFGAVDELNALLGLTRCEPLDGDGEGEGDANGKTKGRVDALLERIQSELFDLGAESATPDPERLGTKLITPAHAATLESAIDACDARLPALKAFILPGGTRRAALLHMARTVCRRAERRLVTLAAAEPISGDLVIYLNRLSDLLFVLARLVNQTAGEPDVRWRG